MRDHIYFTVTITIPLTMGMINQIDQKLKNVSPHWRNTVPVYYESLEEKYKEILKNKNISYRLYADSMVLTVNGFYHSNDLITICNTFKEKITSTYVDETFNEQYARRIRV